jgi:hypothetical protein
VESVLEPRTNEAVVFEDFFTAGPRMNHLADAAFECSLEDVNVAAFAEATSNIGGCDVVEEFLACGIWPLSKSYKFEVERKETPLSKVMVPMPKVTPTIGK